MLPSMGAQRARHDLGNCTPPPKRLLFRQSGALASRPRGPGGTGYQDREGRSTGKGAGQLHPSPWGVGVGRDPGPSQCLGGGGGRYNRCPTNPEGKGHLRSEFVI